MRKVIDFINNNKVTLTEGGINVKLAGIQMVLPKTLSCISPRQLGMALERNLGTANAHYELKSGFTELRIKLTGKVRMEVRYSDLTNSIVGVSLVDESRRSIFNMIIPRLRIAEVSMGTDELIDEIFTDSYEELLSEFVAIVTEEEEVLIS